MNHPLNEYAILLAGQYLLQDYAESVILEDSLAEISYKAKIKVLVNDFPGIIPNQRLTINGTAMGIGTAATLFDGLLWETESSNQGMKHLTLTAYDHTIVLAKSEDEYIFPQGQTAAQRLQKLATDWNIPILKIHDTGISLAKAAYRTQPIFSMIRADLEETVKKGGKMFRPRISAQGLELVELGTNTPVWLLDTSQNLEALMQKRTLEGMVTQVKVLGTAEGEGRSPILAIEKGETEKYGTLQKVLNYPKATSSEAARKAARQLLSGIQETFSVTTPDINTIRAGDKVLLDNLGLLVISVQHTLGSPGRMVLELATEDYVRRHFYHDRPL